LFNLGEDPKGELIFTFTLNPVEYKNAEKAIKKLADAGDTKQADMLRAEQAKPPVVISEQSCSRALAPEKAMNNYFNMLVDRYQNDDEANMLELITNLMKENSIWFSQAHETLYVCKFQE
jgi:hypothetical protein